MSAYTHPMASFQSLYEVAEEIGSSVDDVEDAVKSLHLSLTRQQGMAMLSTGQANAIRLHLAQPKGQA